MLAKAVASKTPSGNARNGESHSRILYDNCHKQLFSKTICQFACMSVTRLVHRWNYNISWATQTPYY